jgi:hypothetical protein
MFGLLAADGGAFLSGLLAEAGTTDSPMMAFWGAQKPL